MALLMAGYHVLLLVTLYLLKPVRDSLFLSSRGPAELPYVFILTTALVVPVAVLHTQAGDRFRIGRLVEGGSLLLILSVAGLRGLLAVGGPWVAYALYAWVSIFGLLVTSQFWLFANALFTSSQAKRIFTALSAGAILGAIIGGQVTSVLVETIQMESKNLLWVAGGVLVAATGLARWIRHLHFQNANVQALSKQGNESDASGALSVVQESRHIQLIVGIIAVTVIVTTLVDYQFKTVASRAYPTEAGLTSFMGQFYGGVSIVALLVQLVLAPKLMRIVGIGGALSMLPGMLALGAVGMLLFPGLVAGVLLRGSEQSLKHSVDKTGRELLFVPVPLEQKKRVKVFIDLFVDQSGQGVGGLLLLILVTGLGLSVKLLSMVVLGFIATWGVMVYRARRSYVDQFRDRLREQESRVEDPPEDGASDVDVDELIDSLCSHAETEALQALEQIEKGSMSVPVDAVLCLLDHPAPAVRQHALRVLRVRRVKDAGDNVAEALRDPDPDVQVEAARSLYCERTENHVERLRQGLRHQDPKVQSAMVGLIAEEGSVEEYELVDESLLRRLVHVDGHEGVETRVQVARMLGVLDRPFRSDLLRVLLNDDHPDVVRAAIRAAGQTNDRSFVGPLIRYVGHDEYERAARQALVVADLPVLGTLYDSLVDPRIAVSARCNMPPIFAERPCQLGVTLLVRSLSTVPVPVRHAAIRSLSKLHKEGDFSYERDRLDRALEEEIDHHAALGQILRYVRRAGGNDEVLSGSALTSLRGESLERIFRLLGLLYEQRDIYDAYLGLTSSSPSLQDSAIEFVDNLLDYETRRMLLPLLDDPAGERAHSIGQTFFDRRIRSQEDVYRYLDSVEDPRLPSGPAEDSLFAESLRRPEEDADAQAPRVSSSGGRSD